MRLCLPPYNGVSTVVVKHFADLKRMQGKKVELKSEIPIGGILTFKPVIPKEDGLSSVIRRIK